MLNALALYHISQLEFLVDQDDNSSDLQLQVESHK